MKTLAINICGLTCENCVEHVSRSLKMTKGVKNVEVDMMSRTVYIKHDDRVCKLNDLVFAVKRVGFQVDGFKSPEVTAYA